MARIASTTTAGVPTGPMAGMTLDALMARAKEAAARQAEASAPQQIQSPWQGAAQLAQSFTAARQGAYAEDQATQGRQRLAQLLSGVDPEGGADPATAAQIYSLDPAAGRDVMQAAAAAIRAKRERDQQLADRESGWAHDATVKQGDRTYEAGQEQTIDSREEVQKIEAEKRAAAEHLAETTAASTSEQVKHERDVAEGRVKHITGDEAKAMNLDPTRQWEVNTSSGQAKDITPTVPESYGPVTTGEAATAAGLDPAKQWQRNLKTNKWETAGGGGITIQNVPAETAARLGLATNFLDSYDSVIAEVDAGNLTGPVDYASSVMLGRGSAGTAYRTIQSGSDALLRNLTGAGMPAAEAAKYVQRYEPTATDDAPTLHSKLAGLKTDLENVRDAVTAGRKWLPPGANAGTATPPPDAAAGALPEGVTEEDITATMAANKMTREQVLAALAAKGGANGGPQPSR